MVKKLYLAVILSVAIIISLSAGFMLQSHSEVQKPAPDSSNITIFLTGDVMFYFAVDSLLDEGVDVFGFNSPFKASDLVVILKMMNDH